MFLFIGFDSEGNEVVNMGNVVKKEETVDDSEVCCSDFPLNIRCPFYLTSHLYQ